MEIYSFSIIAEDFVTDLHVILEGNWVTTQRIRVSNSNRFEITVYFSVRQKEDMNRYYGFVS